MRRLALAFVVVAAFAGCITPSIPIPPPDPSEMMFHFSIDAGVSHVSFNYPANSEYCGGVAYLYDHNVGAGIIKNVNGDCTTGPIEMTANMGDAVDFSVQTHAQTISTCVLVQEGLQSPANECP